MQISVTNESVQARAIDPTAALIRSARNLSPDERYILRRLAAGISRDVIRATAYPGIEVPLPITEFTEQVGVKGKAAYRRLGAAAETIFWRMVEIEYGNGNKVHFRWAGSMCTWAEGFALQFTGDFVQQLLLALEQSERDITPVSAAISSGDNSRPVSTFKSLLAADAGGRSRKYGPQRPPKTMTWIHLLRRVKKRLKKIMPTERAELLIEMADSDEPWYRLSRLNFYDFTGRDLEALFICLLEKTNDPGFGKS